MKTIWLDPLFVTGDPSLQIIYPCVQHSNTVVTSTAIGDLKWIFLGLPLEPGAAVEEVIVCYLVSNGQSFIKLVRIEEMRMPDQALVLHDDPTALQSTAPACYVSNVGGVVPTAAATLALRLNFAGINDEIRLGAVGVKIRPSPACCVNVRDFGAIGQALAAKGSIRVGSKVLTVDTVNGWAVGAGIGIAGAGVGLTPPNGPALVTRIVWIDPINKALHLKDAAANTVVQEMVASDDSLAIQDAIDSLGENGGTVCLPAGTYVIGTTGATTNQPLVVGSNLRIIGAGRGATILQLCQEANMLWLGDAANPLNGLRTAGPIFVNASNFWWFNRSVNRQLPYWGLPHDSNIEIAGVTFEGDKNHQHQVYEPQYRPQPTQMPTPTRSVFLTAGRDAAGQLPAGTTAAPAFYEVFIRFQDATGNEGMGVLAYAKISLGLDPTGQPNNALVVSLPPVFPEGSVGGAVVPYLRRADNSTSTGSINEQDSATNPRYERLGPILLSNIQPWDGNPDPSHWPTIHIRAHTLYPQGPVDTQGNYRFPGIVNFSGNTGASFFGNFINAEKLYLHDIEVRNFVSDGFGLQNVNYSQFDRVHSHHNGRFGVSITTEQMEEVDFNQCVFEANESWAVDMEPYIGKSLRWNRCSFLNNNNGVAISPQGTTCQDLEFNTCLFDGNGDQLTAGAGGGNIVNLKIKDCRFRNNVGNCILIENYKDTQIITGEISGCEFAQANGHGGTGTSANASSFAPGYDTVSGDHSTIVLSGLKTVFRITNNHFKPWAAKQTGADGLAREFCSSEAAIDIRASSGHTIQNNHFVSNSLDTRPLVSYPASTLAWSGLIKNQHFIFSHLDGLLPLGSNKISGNIGDGLIWTGTIQMGLILACGIDLE